MSWKDSYGKITLIGTVGLVIGTIILLQIVLYLLSFIFPTLAVIKLGPAFMFIMAGLIVYTFFNFVLKKGVFDRRDVLYLLMVVGGIIVFFYVSKTYMPQFFSIAVPNQFQGTELFQFTKP